MLKTSRTLLIVTSLLVITAAGFYFFQASPVTTINNSASAPRPNIIFIIADDIAWNDYGFNEHPHITTPHIDRLANEGVLFNNGYSANSICRPSLASIITGLYPSQHGITANARALNQRRDDYDFGLPPYAKRMNTLDTLPRQLARLGYRSLQTGKWWEEGYVNGGFDDGDKKPEGLFRHVTRMNVIGREGLEPLFNFIDNNKQQPFFIWYAPQMPHTPHNPPEKFISPYLDKTNNDNIAKYYGMVSWFDDTIGQIVAHLEAQHLRENTIIIYMADNGVSLHGDIENSGGTDGKDSPFESGNRTPIIFNWPSRWPAAKREALVSTVDVLPTIMDLLQHPATRASGQSLLPTITNNKTPARDFVVGEGYEDSGREVFDSPRKFRWLRQDQWKLIAYADSRIEFFDLVTDPDEQHNLAAQPALLPVKTALLNGLDITLAELKP